MKTACHSNRGLMAGALTLLLSTAVWAQPPTGAQPPATPGYPDTAGVSARPPVVDVPPVYARPAIDTLATIKRRGAIRVGMAASAPWVVRDQKGELIGYSVDLARQLADDLGVRLEIVPTSWSHIIADLLDNHFDVIASGLWLTPARAMMVNYTAPTSLTSVHLVGGLKLASAFKTAADFDRPEVTLVVNAGTPMEEMAARRFPRARLLKVEPDDSPLAPVLEGTAHGAVVATPVPSLVIGAAGDQLFQPKDGELQSSRAALAIRKGDSDFLSYLDAWLVFHKETGWIAEREQYWFRSTDWLKLL